MTWLASTLRNRFGAEVPRAEAIAWNGLLCLVAALAVLSFTGSVRSATAPKLAEQPGEYKLDAADKFRLKAFEWRPALDQVYEWKALNDDYTVGPTGQVSLPLVGELTVRGLTPSEFSALIGETMRQRLGLADGPKISVQITEFRPFYILGDVERPGEYQFRPRMTVLQAVSISAGLARSNGRTQRLDRELITSLSEVEALRRTSLKLLAERARLQADLDNTAVIAFPGQLDDTMPWLQKMMRQESDVLKSQRDEAQAKLTRLTSHQIQLESEITLVKNQLDVHDAERSLADNELETVVSLVKRRLAVEPRRLAAQRIVYQLDADRLRLTSALHRLEEDVFITKAEIQDLNTTRRSKLVLEIKTLDRQIEETDQKLKTSLRLLTTTEIEANALSASGLKTLERTPAYTIVRNEGGQIETLAATEATFIEPGDTVKVELKIAALELARPLEPSKIERLSSPGGPGARNAQPRRSTIDQDEF